MSIIELGALGEFVGAFAVVLTLVYLALQIRQNTKILRAQAAWQLSVEQRELVYLGAGNDAFAEITAKLFMRNEELTDVEWLRMTQWYRGAVGSYEGQWYMYREGTLSKQMWETYLKRCPLLFDIPFVIDWWQRRSREFNDEFAQMCEQRFPHLKNTADRG